MLKKLSVMLAPVVIAFPTACFGSNSGPGYITDMITERGGAAFINSSGAHNGSWPSCATALSRYAIDTNSAAGQAVYATLLSAKLAHTQIAIMGSGTCTIWGDSEDIVYIELPQ